MPDDDSSSITSSISYHSISEDSLTNSLTTYHMSQTPIHEVQMANASTQDPFEDLSIEDKRELLAILQERRNVRTNGPPDNLQAIPAPAIPTVHMARAALPKWSGKAEDFSFYIRRLEARINREWATHVDPCSICLDMIDTLPDEKKTRVAAWFEESSRQGAFSWQNFVEHFRHQFDDKEARQAASEYVARMEQGYNQFFLDFLKDFEYRIAPCREAFTPLGKSIQLKASLNSRLRRALVGVKLPPPENYEAWVGGVAEVAADLEGLNDYRPKNAKYTITKIGAPKGVRLPEEYKSNYDEDGDYKMGESNALMAAIQKLVLGRDEGVVAGLGEKANKLKDKRKSEGKTRLKPRASWRTKEEFRKLVEKNLCTRCGRSGHKGRFCDRFGPPIRPESLAGAVFKEEDSETDEYSGKE